MEKLVQGLSLLLIVVGLGFTVVPSPLGNLLIFLGSVFYAVLTGFTVIDSQLLLILFLLALISIGVDYLAGAVGAKEAISSWTALVGCGLGVLAGWLWSGYGGAVAGFFAGAIIAEIIHGSGLRKGVFVGFRTALGVMFAVVVKVVLGMIMVFLLFARMT